MYIHARVKGPKGSITLPTVPLHSRESERQTKQLKKVDEAARKQYMEIYPEVYNREITVDIKISRSR